MRGLYTMIRMYIGQAFPYIILSLVAFGIFRRLCCRNIKCSDKRREVLLAVTVAYVAGILALTVVPNWHIFRDTITGEIFFSSGISERQTPNLIPFRTILAYLREQVSVNDREIPGHIVMYLGGNLLAFVPLGFLFERLMPKLPVFQVAVGFPFAIETIQYFIGRNADIDDLLLNACGITLGWLFSKVPDRIKGE